jgi:hypothetical protein
MNIPNGFSLTYLVNIIIVDNINEDSNLCYKSFGSDQKTENTKRLGGSLFGTEN